jgi:hypothetical protein
LFLGVFGRELEINQPEVRYSEKQKPAKGQSSIHDDKPMR